MRRGGLGFALTAFVAIRVLGILVLEVAPRSEGRSAYGRLTGWDAQWYAGIARHGYGLTKIVPDGRHLSDYAFFPLYPALERGLADLGPLSVLQAGLIISNVSAVAAAWAIYLLGERVAGRGLILVVLWAALPISVVESMAYSEALFTALAAWSLWSVLGDRWVTAGVLTALAGSTRPVGVAVVAAVLVTVAAAVVVVTGDDSAQVGFVNVSLFKVTAPLRARARPWTVTLLVTVIAVRARMFPAKTELAPSVAVVLTCQNTLQARTPQCPRRTRTARRCSHRRLRASARVAPDPRRRA